MDAGYYVGIAGNQTARIGGYLRALNLPCDTLATSDDWGISKPDPAFFHKLIEVSGHQPHEIAYVGDRLDNDLEPASRLGLFPVPLRRGPWAYVQPGQGIGTAALTTLANLVTLLERRS
jgi:FMN phosphatase YigB (HAD superfamily)